MSIRSLLLLMAVTVGLRTDSILLDIGSGLGK